ncbi:cytochrome P450 [Streptosporangium sp. OZ121]|uniref:cytochrome P450 n=1 Tax=Streptosporangium sp. OZ121 TaxID=3444183 RepID=UPI003F79FCDB
MATLTSSHHPEGRAELFSSARPGFMRDIFDNYRWARKEAPVIYVPSLDLWVATGTPEVLDILKDSESFSTRRNFDSDFELSGGCRAELERSAYFTPALLAVDPPDHERLRSVVAEQFTPRRMRELEPDVRKLVESLADEFAGDTHADLIRRLAYPLPMRVVCDIIGIPVEDQQMIKEWHNQWMALLVVPLDDSGQLGCARALVRYDDYLGDLLDAAGTSHDGRRPTLAHDLAVARAAGSCTREEAIAALRFLLAAGHETVMHTLSNLLYRLLLDGEQWTLLAGDRDLVPAAVEEGLRHDSGAQGTTRHATRDVVVGGVTIPAGARVHVMNGAPGRDPELVEDADTFDVRRRDRTRHHAFGYGVHFCAGAPLARMELRVAVETLTSRFPRMRLVPDFQPDYVPGGYMLRGMASLAVTLDA